ncbi:hypothetical protein RI103_33675 [Paraburkholderia sp. FT54]|uniref:hypothetical protein n=1 Tax=Paraburkholderia sp. FT54 TaxID=3074437 RepID=UPI002877F859|nr:hypothetical protein [Paraburkholderia sp. FT54]WNC94871.1 hypothetical protein RI103_33675 [Paraburkholderia sp. FT54]
MKIQYFLVAAAVGMMTGPAFDRPQTSAEITKETDKTTVTGTATVIATVVATMDPHDHAHAHAHALCAVPVLQGS